jgi:hypothetical protein
MRIVIQYEAQAELQSIYIYYKSILILIANKFKEEVKSKYQFKILAFAHFKRKPNYWKNRK